jgi:CheY-like chemotaxis protein
LTVTDEVRELISQRAPDHAIRKAARSAGMRTLLEDGISKAAQGLTTLDDVLRLAATDGPAASTEPVTPAEEVPPREGASPPPTSVAQAEPQVRDTATATVSVAKDTVPDQHHGKKQRVLVVEDDRTIVMVLKYFLEIEGFEVLMAKDGLAGLEAAKRELPHLIVTDCSMPGMDGVAMVRALRADPSTRGIAVLMLTSEESIETETQALDAGVDDYIHKPVEPRRLAARVKSVLTRSKERQEAVSH